ncbi:MAG: hypothetical protein WCD04_07465 [Terriglobia bacterium]
MKAMPKSPEKIGIQDGDLRELLSFLIKQSPMSREQIAEEMSKSLGQPNLISPNMLNDWTSEYHKAARFPAFFIKAFCDAIGSDRLQRWAAGPRLRKLIEFAERHLELEERRAELLKTKPRRKAKDNRPRKS